jgi:hypothetical protein
MKKSYRLILEVDLDEAEEPNAVRVARRHFRRTGPASTPVNWNRIAGKWRRITAREWIPEAEIAIMELVDANDLLDAAGIEVTSISCVEVRPEKTVLGKPLNSELKRPIRGEATMLRPSPCVKAQDSIGPSPRTHRTTKNPGSSSFDRKNSLT